MRKIMLIMLCFPLVLLAQSGGANTYQLLQFVPASRVAVLNEPIAIYDADVDMGILNPSLLNEQTQGKLSFSAVDYYADINLVSSSYAFAWEGVGTAAVSVSALSLGSFEERTATDELLGTFYAGEQLLTAAVGRSLSDRWRIGASLKTMLSNLESYQSLGLATDIALSYVNEEKNLAFSALAQNIGRQIKSYTGTQEALPFELRLGVSKRLEHLPFRFYLGYNHLEQWNLTYLSDTDVTKDALSGETTVNAPHFGDKLLRHFVLSGELNLGKHIQLRAGYNAQRRHEMTVQSYLGMVGFSWGLGINIAKYQINYGRATYHLAGSPNYFSISTNLSRYYNKQ
jgi:hypothetical protein